MASLPFNVISVSPARDDTGRRVIVNSIGGPSWPDSRTGTKVIENYDCDTVGKFAKTDVKRRALENVSGTVVWGPYHLWYNAKGRVLKDGKYLKHRGQYILKEQRFVTAPYWCVFLDGYEREMMFVEEEIRFV